MVYVVERYLPGLTRSDLLRGLSRLEQAAEAKQTKVRYLGSTIVLEDEACFCQFEGPSEAAVAEANRLAGLRYDRIVPAVTVTTTTKGGQMNVLTDPFPGTVQISRGRLLGLIVGVAATAAALTGVTVALTVGGGSTVTSALSPEVQAAVNNIPLIPQIKGARVLPTSPEQAHVQAIVSLTPAELVAAFGTETEAAAVLATLSPSEREHVKAIMALSPEQLRAAYGTASPEAAHVRAIVSLTPAELVAAFGTNEAAAAVLASLSPAERSHVKSIMALTPAQLRAAFGTVN